MELLYLLLGWALGLLSPVIVERILRIYSRNEFMEAVVTELRDVRLRLVLTAYRCRSHLGTVDDRFADWVQPIMETYQGHPEMEPRAFEAFRNIKALPEANRRAFHLSRRLPGVSPRLSKFALEFLANQIGQISKCPLEFQVRLGSVRAQLEFYNDQVEFVTRMYDLTFDQAITGENRDAVLGNLERGYEKVADRAELV